MFHNNEGYKVTYGKGKFYPSHILPCLPYTASLQELIIEGGNWGASVTEYGIL